MILLRTTLLFSLIFVTASWALAGQNQQLVYQGRIIRPDGTPIDQGILAFTLSVYSPSPSDCLLYRETQSLDMTGKSGMFSLEVGAGTRVDTGAHPFSKIFVNGATLSSLPCGTGTSYTSGATDDRKLVVTFNDSGRTVTLSPMSLKSVPYALQAQEVSGWGINNLVKVSNVGSPTTFTTAEMANAKTITGLNCAPNEILKWDGSTWLCATDAVGSAASDASYSAKGVVQIDTNSLTSGLAISSGVLKLSSTGVTASSYGSASSVPVLAVDAQGRITSAVSTSIALPASQLTQSGASSGQVLKWNGSAWAPANESGITTDATYVAKGLVQFDTDAATSGISLSAGIAKVNVGTGAHQIVKLDGTGKLPALDGSALSNLSASSYSGVLPVANGGTNSSTALNNNRLMISSSGAIVEAPAMTNGQIVVGSTGAAPQVATLGSSNGISITTGAGSLSIATNATNANTVSTIVSRDASGNFAAGAITNTSNILKGATAGTVTMTVPTSVTSYTLTWPSGVGSAGQFLTTDASGNLSWGSPSGVTDGSYATKGILQGLTDAATSGLNISSGVISVNSGTAANQIVKLNGSAQLPAVDGSLLTNLNAGNIASGVLPIARGGTNNGSLAVTAGGILYTDGTKLMNTGAGSSGQALISAGAGSPAFGTLGVTGGGTGATSYAANSLIMANGTGSAFTSMTCSLNQILKWDGTAWSCAADATGSASGDAGYGAGNKGIVAFDTDAATSGVSVASGLAKVNTGTAANQIVKLDSSARIPAVDGSLLTNLSASQISSGTLPIARGGTNSATALNNNRLMISSSGAIVEAPAMTNGQIIVGSTGASPQVATLGSSNGISITTGAGSLSIATNATDTNTASTIVSRDASGNFAAGAITNTSNILKGSTSGTLTMTVPTSVTSYTLTWPSAVGSAGQVLMTDATGNLSWGSAGSGGDASYAAKGVVQGLTDAATSGLNISSGVISVNSGTSANQIVKLNASAQLPAVDGSLLTNLSATNIASGVLPVARGGTNNGSLAVTAGGMIYSDGTKLMNTGAGTSGQALISAAAGAPAFGTLGIAGGGTGASSLAANRLIGTNGTGTTMENVTCSQNQLISFDASGNYGCYNASALLNGSYFVSGGNSFTAAATLGTNDAYSLSFKTNNTSRITLDSTGNIGIGTSTPGSSLEVASGQIRTPAGSVGTPALAPRTDTDTGFYFTGSDIRASIDGANRFALMNTIMETPNVVRFSSTASTGYQVGSNNEFQVFTNSTERLTVSQTGNVGIGTTSPGTLLDVNGALSIRGMAAPAASPAGQGRIYFDSTANKFKVSENNGSYVDLVGGGGSSQWTTNGTTISYTAGNVGIGTTSPAAKLDVSGQIVSKENIVASGATVDFANGNTQILQAVGGATITLNNMVNGGQYTVIVEDTTARTYSFANCTTTRAVPALSETTGRSIFTILKVSTACYITWITGF